jgi:hypothetical protein
MLGTVGGSSFFFFHPRIVAHATTPSSPTAPTARLAIKMGELSALSLLITDEGPIVAVVYIGLGGGGGGGVVTGRGIAVVGGATKDMPPWINPLTDATTCELAGRPAASYTGPMFSSIKEPRSSGSEARKSDSGDPETH